MSAKARQLAAKAEEALGGVEKPQTGKAAAAVVYALLAINQTLADGIEQARRARGTGWQ